MSAHSTSGSQSKAGCRTAFVSGHTEMSTKTFLRHYESALETAIVANNSFVLSNAPGADSQALEYLLDHDVSPSKITIYVHTPPTRPPKAAVSTNTIQQIDDLRAAPETLKRYREQGLGVKVVDGSHGERDAVMTRDSDYDILWVRSDEETKELYAWKYRPGRVSATQKNRDRRELMAEADAASMSS